MNGSKLLGATVYVPLPKPATFTATWPLMHYDIQELTLPPYTTGTAQFTASNVASLLLVIDLSARSIVQVAPDPNATISNLPHGFFSTTLAGGQS